ncbi:MAG: hypothetical protein IT320_00860 [Anaerolineae bacterium]|nr:hypothetical protein [Anaerolineae bacterium]
MRNLIILGGLLILLIIGGGLTSQLIANQDAGVLPILTQTVNPDASPTSMLPWKAEQFFLLVGFILFNLVGIALTIALVIWLIDWGLKRKARNQPPNDQQQTASG